MFSREIDTRDQQGNAVVGGGCRRCSARPCHHCSLRLLLDVDRYCSGHYVSRRTDVKMIARISEIRCLRRLGVDLGGVCLEDPTLGLYDPFILLLASTIMMIIMGSSWAQSDLLLMGDWVRLNCH